MLTHNVKDFPLLSDDDEYNRIDYGTNGDNDTGPVTEDARGAFTDVVKGTTINAEPSGVAPVPNFDVPPTDLYMNAETLRYLKARLAKGKFLWKNVQNSSTNCIKQMRLLSVKTVTKMIIMIIYPNG